MGTIHGQFFARAEGFWLNLRRFCFNNRTIFEILFILIYALEQGILIWFTFKANSLSDLGFIVAIFAIVVLTTFALRKLMMQSWIKVLEEELYDLQLDKFALEARTKNIIEKYKELNEAYVKFISEDLNSSKNHRIEERGKK